MTIPASGQTTIPPQIETLGDLLEIISRRRSLLKKIFLITILAAVGFSLLRPPAYEASSTVVADRTPPVVFLTGSGREASLMGEPLAQPVDVYTLSELAKSGAVRDGAVARLAPSFDPKTAEDILRRHLRVEQVRTTQLVRISVRYGDPITAAAMANAAAQSVVDMDRKARRSQATIAREFVGEQLERAGRDLRASQHALAAFKQESHNVSLSDETQLDLRKLADLQTELIHARLQEQQAQAGFTSAFGASPQGAPQESPDPVITTLQSQLDALKVEYSGLRKQFTPIHPQVLSTQAKIDETQRRLSAEIARRQSALSARELNLSSEITKLEHTLMQAPSREALLARLTLDNKEAERKYLLLSERYQEARIAEGSIGSVVRVVDVAQTSTTPLSQRRIILIAGIILGLGLGVAGAFVAEHLDERIHSQKEVERVLAVPVLGALPFLATGEGPSRDSPDTSPVPLIPFDQPSGVREAFRLLRTHTLCAIRDAGAKSLIVTSALPGEGKTTLVANLAVAAAQTDRRVWLIDCDLRHPTLDRLFPEAQSPGLSSFLAGRAAMDNVVKPTREPQLNCVVSGAGVSARENLIDTRQMTQFMDGARESADLVLLDCPAILPVADAEVVGLQADGAVIVVLIGKTSRRALTEAGERLARSGVRIIGAVVNRGGDPSSLHS